MISYSMGTTAAFYALAQEPDYYSERVHLSINLAPAIEFNHANETFLIEFAHETLV